MDSKKINQLGTEVDPQQSDLTVIGDPISGQLKKITWLQVAHLIGAQASVTLQQVTDSGNTTTDPITTGGLTLSNLGTGLPRLTSGEFVGTYGYGLANGVATLDSGGKIPASQLPSSVMEYKGLWNASTNTPTLADGTGDNGDVYLVSVAGSQNLGSGTISFAVGDWAVYNGTIWQKSLNSNAVASVFGRTGTIVAQEGDYNIDQLGDVTITSAVTNDYLRYNGTSWVNTQFPAFVSSDKLVLQVRNNSGATINKGTVVYINGATAGYPTIAKAQADADATSAQTIGMVQDNISNNSNGIVVLVGQISGVDTSAFTSGTQLYLSGTTAGAYTSTKALAPTHLVYVGVVTSQNAVNGVIEVKIQNGYELEEIHDVAISSVANNQGLFYESSTDLWKNKSIATILGGTPIIGSGTNTEMAYFSPNGNTLTSSPFFYISDVGTKKALTFKALYNYITTEDNIIGGVTNPDLNLVISGDDNILFKVTNASVTAAKIKDGGNVELYYDLSVTGTSTFTDGLQSKNVRLTGGTSSTGVVNISSRISGIDKWGIGTVDLDSSTGSNFFLYTYTDAGVPTTILKTNNRSNNSLTIGVPLDIQGQTRLTTGDLILPANNTVGGTNYGISQSMATSDSWKIYGNSVAANQGELVFEVEDDGYPIASNGQRFRFKIGNTAGGTAKNVLILDHDISTFDTELKATINSLSTAATTFLVSDSGTIKSRTAANVLSDIEALPLSGGTLTGPLNGTSAYFNSTVTTPAGFYIDANTYLYEGILRLTDLVNKKNILQLQSTASGHYITSTFLSGGSQQAIYLSAKSTAGQNVTFNTDGTTTFGHGISGTSATFSGDLTIDTNTLYVDSTNNRVGIGTTPETTFHLLTSGLSPIRLTLGSEARVHNITATNNGRDLQILPFRGLTLKTGNGIAEGVMILSAYEDFTIGTGSSYTARFKIDNAGSIAMGDFTPSGTPAADYRSFEIGRQGNTITAAPWKSNLYLSTNATITAGSSTFTYRNSSTVASILSLEGGNLTFSNAASGTSGNTITFSEKMKVSDDGYLRLASKGIQFNGDTADANSLDDYEEGTWTPAITYDSGTSGVTYSGRAGKYTKIGRVVHIEFVIGLSSKGTGNNDVTITGLPFTVANDMASGEPAAVNISYVANLSTSVYFLNGWANNNSTILQLRKQTSSTTTMGQSYVLIGDISDTLYIQGCCTYHV